jgi:acyl-CoA reductase-like NAD-dependent aldehyde dehydrogenase
MAMSLAGRDRARRHDQALDDDRRSRGVDRNRDAADQRLEPSHGDPPRSRNTPNTGNGRGRPMTGEQLTPEEQERQAAADAAAALAVALLRQPLTWQQRRQADRAAGVAARLMHLEDNRRRGIR